MEMGRRVPLRLTPEYRFEYDDTLEEAELVRGRELCDGLGLKGHYLPSDVSISYICSEASLGLCTHQYLRGAQIVALLHCYIVYNETIASSVSARCTCMQHILT
jgi:hypothetical protein